MENDDITHRMLGEIKDELRAHDRRFEQIDQRFERIDQRFEQIDQRFEQIDQRFERGETRLQTEIANLRDALTRRIAESEIRMVTEVHAVHGSMRDVIEMLRKRELEERVGRCEREIDDLKRRIS